MQSSFPRSAPARKASSSSSSSSAIWSVGGGGGGAGGVRSVVNPGAYQSGDFRHRHIALHCEQNVIHVAGQMWQKFVGESLSAVLSPFSFHAEFSPPCFPSSLLCPFLLFLSFFSPRSGRRKKEEFAFCLPLVSSCARCPSIPPPFPPFYDIWKYVPNTTTTTPCIRRRCHDSFLREGSLTARV